jgi:hypothetical protein
MLCGSDARKEPGATSAPYLQAAATPTGRAEMADILIPLTIIAVLIVISVVISRLLTAPLRGRTASPTTASTSDGFETLLGFLLIAGLSAAALKFIAGGGLQPLMKRIAGLPIEVNGRRTTIAAAVADDQLLERLLREAIQAKLSGTDHQKFVVQATQAPTEAANSVAEMLRQAVGERMRQRGV